MMAALQRKLPRCTRSFLPSFSSFNTVAPHSRGFRSTSRCPSTAPLVDPQEIASAFLSKFASGAPTVRTQLLDSNQLRLFSLTLNRPKIHPFENHTPSLESIGPAPGTIIPPAYHLAYFTPSFLNANLGPDGSDMSYNPLPPFTRRMWAGGAVSWPGARNGHFLRVGDVASETTKVLSCETKIVRKTGEHMLLVRVQKDFRDSDNNLCVIDERNWVFREALDPLNPPMPAPKRELLTEVELEEMGKRKVVRKFCRSEVELFRFSALTFNGHRIHYDKPWAVGVEGHRNVVVHGPLNLISMVDLFLDQLYTAEDSGSRRERAGRALFPQRIDYRATSPVYAGEGYRIFYDGQGKDTGETGHKADMTVVSDDGTVCMKGIIKM